MLDYVYVQRGHKSDSFMKKLTLISITRLQLGVAICLCLALTAKAQVNLGAAGNYALLETGSGNVNIANASSAGGINGNVGIANGGSLGDSGTPIHGNVVTYANPAGNPPINPNVVANVSGTISQNSAALTAAVNAANAAELAAVSMSASGGGIGVTSITSGGTINPGVYNLTTFNLPNGAILNLNGGGYYVFNISGGLTLNSARVLAASGLNLANILFNVTGGGVGFSGGLNQESILDGVILDLNGSNIGIAPGVVDGEIISNENVGIASGASCLTPPTPAPVPEASTVFAGAMMLLPLGIGAIRALRRSRAA